MIFSVTHPFLLPCHDAGADLVGCEYWDLADEMIVCSRESHPSTEGEESWTYEQSRFEASRITCLTISSQWEWYRSILDMYFSIARVA